MKRLGWFALGGAVVAAVGTVAACSGDEADGGGTPDSGAIATDASASSSSGNTCPPEPPMDAACNVAKCTADLGEPAICNAGACQKLASEDCAAADVFGAYTDDRAIWIGGALAMVQANGKINTSGPPRRNSIQFAVDQINGVGGVPPTDSACGAARPLAAIVCDDGGGRNASGMTDATERAGKHLVQELGIQAIIGAGTSGPTIAMAQKIALPAKALMIAPSATAIAITDLEGANPAGEPRLLWRTAPSDLLQSQALLKLYEGVVAKQGGTTKLAVVDKGDAYGKGLGDAFQAAVVLNGSPIPTGAADAGDGGGNPSTENYYRGQCAASAAPADAGLPLPCQAQVAALEALRPTIIMLAGTAESITQIMVPYEATLGASDPKPFYLLPDGPAKTELFDAVKAKPELAERIQGTVPGASTTLATNFFDLGYKLKFPQVPDENGSPVDSTLLFGMAGSYDATYLITYAMVASKLPGKAYTGSQIAAGFAQQIAGTPIDVGFANFGAATTALRSGLTIDFNGASGPLTFDLATGTAPSDMIIWCVRKNPSSATGDYQRYDSTGQTFNSQAGTLDGTYTCPN